MEYIDEYVRYEYHDTEKVANQRLQEVRAMGRRALKVVLRRDCVEIRILPTYRSASVMAKAAGLSSLAEMARICGKPENTLHNWWRDEPLTFTAMLEGCVAIKGKARKGNE